MYHLSDATKADLVSGAFVCRHRQGSWNAVSSDHFGEQTAIKIGKGGLKPGVHTNDFATIHGRPARIHTAPAESTVDSTYCLPRALCEYARGDRESWRNR